MLYRGKRYVAVASRWPSRAEMREMSLREVLIDPAEMAELDAMLDYYATVTVPLLDSLQGADCYRTMRLDEGVDPAAVDPLGVYWSHTSILDDLPGGAGTGPIVVYRARIDLDQLDTDRTALVNVWAHENELMWNADAPIFVYDALVSSRNRIPSSADDPGTVLVEINDWRRT